MSLGVNLIENERIRQINSEGWTEEHDDEHTNNSLALAAVCYAIPSELRHYSYCPLRKERVPDFWPWDKEWWKPRPEDRIRELTISGALIVAEIERLKRIEIKQAKEKLIPKIKKMVDNAFGEFGKEGDNILLLSACYYSEDSRNTYEIDEPLYSINFNKGSDYNNLYFPIGRNWDLGNWERDGIDEDKLKALYEVYTEPICEALNQCFIDCYAEDYYRSDNDALNECWCGVIGVMRDYKIVSFVIRKDGLLCNEGSINQGYNKIIEQL